MAERTLDTTLNLGRYSIRSPDEMSDLKVGSFYRRKLSAADAAADSSDSTQIYSLPKKKKVATEDKLISVRQQSSLRGSITSRSTSYDSDSAAGTARLVIGDTFPGSSSINNNLPSSSRNKSLRQTIQGGRVEGSLRKHLSIDPTPALIIDTQSDQAAQDTQESHESFVIELNPNTYDNSHDSLSTISSITPSEGLHNNYSLRTPDPPRVQMRLKIYPKELPYDKIMSGVVFVMSGIANPKKGKLRDLALQMGAKYQPKWTRFCTHLICAFKHTPKYKEVMAENGRIVREHWIQWCSKERKLLDWRSFKLGKYPYPDSEEEVDDLDRYPARTC